MRDYTGTYWKDGNTLFIRVRGFDEEVSNGRYWATTNIDEGNPDYHYESELIETNFQSLIPSSKDEFQKARIRAHLKSL